MQALAECRTVQAQASGVWICSGAQRKRGTCCSMWRLHSAWPDSTLHNTSAASFQRNIACYAAYSRRVHCSRKHAFM